MENIAPATQETSLASILDAAAATVLLEVTAPWCGAGHLLAPIVRRTLERFNGRLPHLVVDAERHPEILRVYGVHKLPTLLFIRGAELVGSLTGAVPENELIECINELFEIRPDQTETP